MPAREFEMKEVQQVNITLHDNFDGIRSDCEVTLVQNISWNVES